MTSDAGRRLVDDVTPNTQAVDRFAAETVDRMTSTHRSILWAVDDRYRGTCRRRPAKLHGDKGYEYDHLRRWRRSRYERKAEHFLAFAGIAAIQICYRRLVR